MFYFAYLPIQVFVGLNENIFHRQRGSAPIRRYGLNRIGCGLAGGNMSLDVGFEVSVA